MSDNCYALIFRHASLLTSDKGTSVGHKSAAWGRFYMITSKQNSTAEEYPIATLLQRLQHARTPTQRELAPVRPAYLQNTHINPRLPLPRPTHSLRPQHLATTPQTPLTPALPPKDPVPDLAVPRSGFVGGACGSVGGERGWFMGQASSERECVVVGVDVVGGEVLAWCAGCR